MRFVKIMLSFVFCLGIGSLQAMQVQKKKTTAKSNPLREIFVTDGRIKGFLKKHCGLDISEKWQKFIETNGYLECKTPCSREWFCSRENDWIFKLKNKEHGHLLNNTDGNLLNQASINDQKLADFFKDDQLDQKFKLFLEQLSDDIKKAFKKIRKHNDNNLYNYRHGIKCQFLQLFDWFTLKKDKKTSLDCYNLVERCPQDLPEAQSLFKELYSAPASLLDKHPNDRAENLDELVKEVEYARILDCARYPSLILSSGEEGWEKGNSFIEAIEQLILFHFTPDNFIRRLKKGDVSYLSEPLCGFILKQYHARAVQQSEMCSVRYTLKEDNELLPKLFEDYKPEGSKVARSLGLLGLMLVGQITGPEAQKIAQARHTYVQREQDIANDKIVLRTFDVPLCESPDQNYTCQGTLSARNDKGNRMLDVKCVCNQQVHLLGDHNQWHKEQFFNAQEPVSSNDLFSVNHSGETALIPNKQGKNAYTLLYKQGGKTLSIGKKPCVMTIKEKQFHNFDTPSMCTGSLSSNNDVIKELDLACVEQPYNQELVENTTYAQDDLDREIIDPLECRNGIDCCTDDTCGSFQESAYVDHINEVTMLVLDPSKITVNVIDISHVGNLRKTGYKVCSFSNTNELLQSTQQSIVQKPNPKAWMVCHLEGDASKVDILKEIQHHGNNRDLLIVNGTIIMRKTYKAWEIFESLRTQNVSFVGENTSEQILRERLKCSFGSLSLYVCDCSIAADRDDEVSYKKTNCTSECTNDSLYVTGCESNISICRNNTENN